MAKDKDTNEIIETLNFIVTRMATKDDIATIRNEMATEFAAVRSEIHESFLSLRAEIRDIHNRLDTIDAELKNHAGYAKDIDHLMDRVRAIEKHLGIQQKIAA